MQYRLQDELVPLALAHLMGRSTETNDKGPIRFRVQADRRRVQALANGAADRRLRRVAAAGKIEDAEILKGKAASPSPRIVSND